MDSFAVKFKTVDAVHVTVHGEKPGEHYFVPEIGMLVPIPLFRALYSPVEAVDAALKDAPPKREKPASITSVRVNGDAAPKPLSITGAIKQALSEGPRTNQEVLARITELGIETDSSTVSTILCQLRQNQNYCYKRDEDLRWVVAERATKS